MGLDKLTGRVKQAAGDLAGNEDLRRQGAEEERKGEAKEELARADARAETEEARAEARQDAAEQRASDAARKEFAKADAEIEREQRRADAERDRADAKRAEVDDLEQRTDPDALKDAKDKDELYEQAQALDIPGRSDMTKDELAEAVARER